MIKPKILVAGLAVLSIIMGLGSFYIHRWSKPPEEKVETVRIAECAPSVYHLPYQVAREMDFFKQEKLKIKVKTYAGEAAALNALVAGEADIALVGLEELIYARTGNLRDHSGPVAFACLAAKNDSFLLARESKEGFSWADLKGKSVICGPPESIETVILEEIMRRNNLSRYENVTLFTNIPKQLMAGALKSGTGNYILLREPEASLAEAKGEMRVTASLGKEIGAYPAVVYAANAEYINKHPAAVQKFTNAVYKAQIWMKYHNAAEVRDLCKKNFRKMNRDIYSKLVNQYFENATWPQDPLIKEEEFKTAMKMLSDAREIPREIPYELLVDERFARQAMAGINYIPEDKLPKKKFPANILEGIKKK